MLQEINRIGKNYMYRIEQMKLPIHYTESDLKNEICRELRISQEDLASFRIAKRSLDARKKHDIHYVLTVDININKNINLNKILKNNRNISKHEEVVYNIQFTGNKKLHSRPVVIGAGPAGLFCAYNLAKKGLCPILAERGDTIENRVKTVNKFWETGLLDPNSNVQFGEGGAGTFSDGKLNTMVKDKNGRIKEVLSTFVEFGAPEEILYHNKPHIGTDLLRDVIQNMTARITELGGTCLYRSVMTDFTYDDSTNSMTEIELNHSEIIPCEVLVLAIGHSARDTFRLLYDKKINMEKKAFAVGFRLEHPQEMISRSQYGDAFSLLPPADYKLTNTTSQGRGVYSFCMCPGGFVVNASSEAGHLAVNGMSNYKRDERNANSAIIVTVTPEDFIKISSNDTPLAGIDFQRHYERLAYQCANGKVPFQLYCDLKKHQKSRNTGRVIPNIKGACEASDLSHLLPEFVIESILESMPVFGKKIPGFDMEDAVFEGVETRTSSPVRILRDEHNESNIKGLYPCGEGAGYAGGIVSAAVDGLKIVESIAAKYSI